MNFEISLNDIRFHARHGVFQQENAVGNEFSVDVSLTIPYNPGVEDDDLDATISYADVYEIIAEEMKRPRKLLEAVAASIAKRFTAKWPEIEKGHITICKSTPPIAGITGNAAVTLNF